MKADSPDVQALVVVDLQRAFVSGPGAAPSAEGVLGAMGRQLAAARSAGALVVHLQNDGAPGTLDEPGTDGWELAIPVDDGEVLVRKGEDDGFVGTGLAELLRGRGVAALSIGGVMSEMCVAATARGALRGGFGVVVAQDSHGTYDVPAAGAAPMVPTALVSRVAEWSLGDEPFLVASAGEVRFSAP